MADKMREPGETKEIGIKRLKESFEKNNNTVCPPSKVKEFERIYEREILPEVYRKDKK